MKTSTSIFFTTIAFVIAIALVLFSNSLMPFIWKIYYGDQMYWNDLRIKISSNEHFRPRGDSKSLYIGTQNQESLLIIKKTTIPLSVFRERVKSLCSIPTCVNYSEEIQQTKDEKILQISFANSTDKAEQSFFAFFYSEEKKIEVEFRGAREQLASRQQTIKAIFGEI
jgi:hypothetical protein